MKDPLVSVIIPCFNAVSYLGEALESALKQSYRPLEVIVVDDGSTDGSGELADSYAPGVRVIHQANQGEGPARNTGIRASKGDFLAFLDADDWWDSSFLSSSMAEFQNAPNIGVVFGGVHHILNSKIESSLIFAKRYFSPPEGAVWMLEEKCSFPVHSALVRRECIDAVLPFGNLIMSADFDLWLRAGLKFSMLGVSDVKSYYRHHDGQVTRVRWKMPWYLHHVSQRFYYEHRHELPCGSEVGLISFSSVIDMMTGHYLSGNKAAFLWYVKQGLLHSRKTMRERMRFCIMLICSLFGHYVFERAAWFKFDPQLLVRAVLHRGGAAT
jgi:glycosyltransferase involved in cell wall biosynthesis